jgi:hypothetical protein
MKYCDLLCSSARAIWVASVDFAEPPTVDLDGGQTVRAVNSSACDIERERSGSTSKLPAWENEVPARNQIGRKKFPARLRTELLKETTTIQPVRWTAIVSIGSDSKKFTALSLLEGISSRGDEFRRTASATRKSPETGVISQGPKCPPIR